VPPRECGTLQIRIRAEGELMLRSALVPVSVPNRGGGVDKDALAAALARLAADCVGAVAITAPADVEYQRVLDVIDAVKRGGFTSVTFEGGGAALNIDLTR
jgi:biopolymer transport protein ExbD